jgi:hypothetical protein
VRLVEVAVRVPAKCYDLSFREGAVRLLVPGEVRVGDIPAHKRVGAVAAQEQARYERA